ncbi:MAG: hypothetical protein HY824_13130 [Acidobacteria bacterium]|nr:hypothetical protein [Acidobacteriota bacterium]
MTAPLILAIEADARQAAQLTAVAGRLSAELRLVSSAGCALASLDERLPDLILTPALLSHRDDLALALRLRELGGAGAHIQTLTIPTLDAAEPPRSAGVLAVFRRDRPRPAGPAGCTVEIFAGQVAVYLARATGARRAPPADMAAVEAAPWHIFDPQQARFAALLARLDEIAAG